ncbi:MAG TPA: non-homologous end-joining DNA ligase, partial [Candidatus Dormibacteraeota bacterium]|nr:non-homologous end-joining DNA ligase [Candidatus Dormibacteraeota bacterium]
MPLRNASTAAPAFIEPMKAALAEKLPQGSDWLYEIKFDGVRALAIKNQKQLSLLSRAANDLGVKYPEIVQALAKVPARQMILDGEVVAVDELGRSSFQLLQSSHMPGQTRPPLFYYVFDLLNLNGRDLTNAPLTERKQLAERLVKGASPLIRFSGSIKADSPRVIAEMKARGLEGLIAKKRNSLYEPGRRSGAWIKFKWTNEQEFVIGGYTRPKGARTHFGSVLVGYYENRKLLFAAKVGTGFDQELLDSLYDKFQKLLRADCPFANLPEPAGSHGRGLTRAEMRRCTWVEPKLVCQVRFAEWT